jgi:hypothetical protein
VASSSRASGDIPELIGAIEELVSGTTFHFVTLFDAVPDPDSNRWR